MDTVPMASPFKARLKRLSQSIHLAVPKERRPPVWRPDEERLADLDACAGEFENESDFPRALELYRDAIQAATASIDPPFEPPDDFRAGQPRFIRLYCWRCEGRFPQVVELREWLSEMHWRKHMGIPPVSEAEFADLAMWFSANEERLQEMEKTTSLLAIGNGEATSCWQLRSGIQQGPREDGAGRVADDLRLLRARYGGPS